MRDVFDVLVLGGGSAGCVLAARLSENPDRRVCLVEAGPDYGPFDGGRWPADVLDARRLPLDSHCWETDREDRSQLRARILGGCSAHNACVLLEGAPADYDEWGPGWTYDELRPYLERARRELRTRELSRDELSPWHRAFADAGGDDSILHPVNMVDGVRWNTAFAYLDPARGRPNLTIRADTLVDRVLLDGDGAVGATTATGEVRADTIVLAAGAYGTPGILLRSRIGPETGLPVGEGLIDHVGVGMAWEPTDALQQETARYEAEYLLLMGQVTVSARSTACPEDVCDLFVFPAVDPGYEISGAVFMMKPESRGSVRLNSPEPTAPLAIDHGFLREQGDAEALAEGFEKLRELGSSPQAAPYAARELRPAPEVDATTHVREAARGFFHPVGTCAIGSVVDERGRVFGREGLVVADASIMPSIPRANTNLSVVAIAERIAELV